MYREMQIFLFSNLSLGKDPVIVPTPASPWPRMVRYPSEMQEQLRPDNTDGWSLDDGVSRHKSITKGKCNPQNISNFTPLS